MKRRKPRGVAPSNATPRSQRHAKERLSYQLQTLLEKAEGRSILFGDLLKALSRNSHAVTMVLLSSPLLLPVGIPVLTTLFGLTLAFVGISLILGRALWVPRRLREKEVSYDRLAHLIERLLRITQRIERLLHPRWTFLAGNGMTLRVHGGLVLIMALLAAVPIPLPMGNAVAAFPILLMGLALLERDGVLVLVSYLASVPCFVYYAVLVILGRAGLERMLGM